MELSRGYGQCDGDVFPGDWEWVHMAERSTLKARIGWQGLTTKEYLERGNYYLVTGTNLRNGRVDWAKCWFVSQDRYAQDPNIQLRSKDVIITKDGTIGKTAYIDSLPGPATLNSGVFVIRPKHNAYEPLYLFYVLSSDIFAGFLVQLQAGSTISHLYQKDFVGFGFMAPELVEQRALAAALSDADALISSLEKLIAKKQNIKKGAMQMLLTGRKRLPGFTERWVTKELGAITDVVSGGTPSTRNKAFWGGSICWCTPTDVTSLDGGKYLFDTQRRITALGLKSSAGAMLPKDSLVVTSRATIGECAINKVPVSTNQGFKSLIPKAIDVEFLYYNVLTQKQALIRLGSGSTFFEVSKKDMEELTLLIPPSREEQAAIAQVLSDMDYEITSLERKLEKSRLIKKGMMHELLTGKKRLICEN